MFNMDDWKILVDSLDMGDMRLYHAYAYNEKTRQVIEGMEEGLDEEAVRANFQHYLMGTLMQMEMERQYYEQKQARATKSTETRPDGTVVETSTVEVTHTATSQPARPEVKPTFITEEPKQEKKSTFLTEEPKDGQGGGVLLL